MKKRITKLFLAAICLILTVSVFSVSAADRSFLVDNAGLLSGSEQAELNNSLSEISDHQSCDVVIVTVQSLEGKTAQAYADDYYDQNGYGKGDGRDGILFLLSMEARDWAISTCGYGITAFTDAGQRYIIEEIKPDLSNGDYNAAFTGFADQCDDFLTQAHTAEPYDGENMPVEKVDPLFMLLICFVIGLIVALIVTGVMKSQLKSVAVRNEAADYMRKGSLNVTGSRELFLYSHVDRTEKPKDDDNSSTGSSTHTSSSGTEHGGSSGKF